MILKIGKVEVDTIKFLGKLEVLTGLYSGRSGLNTGTELGHMTFILQSGQTESLVSSLNHTYPHDQAMRDWSDSMNVAHLLRSNPGCESVMDKKLRGHPLVRGGARAISIDGNICAFAGLEDPNANEAVIYCAGSGSNLISEDEVSRISGISGIDPYAVLSFDWNLVKKA